MAGTQINQQRQAVVVSGTVKYTITTTCTVRGTLQDTGIFLLNIVTPGDPKDDAFLRIIQIADVDEYSTSRDTAIADNTGAWRSSSVTIVYDDIEVANAAWKEFNSRINTLVNTYDTYLTEFNTFTGGNVIAFPTVDESAKTELKEAYAATVPLVAAAQTALTTHQLECTQEEADLATIEERLQEARADLVPLLAIQSTVAAVYATDTVVYTTLFANNTQIRSNNATSAAADPEKDAIEALLLSNDNMLSQFNAQNTSLSTVLSGNIASAVATLQARIVTLTQEKNDLLVQLNKCHIENSKLEAAVTAAIAEREAALAAVIAVCPDFVP